MGMKERPSVIALADGGKYWEHEYEKFYLKNYIPANELDGEANNYNFKAPLLLVFEEKKLSKDEAIGFAEETGLADIAASTDTGVIFVYPTNEGGWKNATEELYSSLIAEVKMNPYYKDGIVEVQNFFTREFQGYFIRGAIFRADIYSYGESADYVAKNLLKTINGEYLWGPGEITPAMCSMQNLSVVPNVERKDIAILSVGNSEEVNKALAACENFLVKEEADYKADYKAFVRKFKMWCGRIELEPNFEAMNMTEEAGSVVVKTSPVNRLFKDPEHKVGYFAYYNNELFKDGPVPLLVGFHGGGDTSMYLTYVAGWYEIAHRYNFLFVSLENHQGIPASEVVQIIDHLKKTYNIDEHRIYATGFSMGSGKTWDMYQEYPEIFAGLAPASALFPVRNNMFGAPADADKLNTTVPVPIFYSGGEKSHLPELPFQAASGLERIQYAAEVNKLKANFKDIDFENKDKWADPIWGVPADRVEKIFDESRGSYLTINYYDSEDGVCRTAFASVSEQVHECRHHTNEHAWKFISQFSR